MLADGSDRAREIAAKTMNAVKDIVGLLRKCHHCASTSIILSLGRAAVAASWLPLRERS